MRKHLLSGLIGLSLLSALVSGCTRSRYQAGEAVEVPAGSFVQGWKAPLKMAYDEDLTRLFLRDNTLVAYTDRNLVYSMEAQSGKINWAQTVAPAGHRIQPPVMLKDRMVIPTDATLEVFSPTGQLERSLTIGHAIRSPMNGDGRLIYGGLDYSIGGRFAQVDVDQPYNFVRWEIMTQLGVSSMPVVYQKTIYFASEGGQVYAVNDEKAGVWALAGGYFKTDGAVIADLRVDDYGLYVACADGQLYCLDRSTGKIKWRYFAGKFLLDAPEVTADTVYEVVRDRGVAAIDKTTGPMVREPRWFAKGAKKFLSEDEKYAYLCMSDSSIVALDRKTGEEKFRSRRTDLTVFASNTKDSTIYAASREGTVIGVKPVTRPGSVGAMVRGELELQPISLGG